MDILSGSIHQKHKASSSGDHEYLQMKQQNMLVLRSTDRSVETAEVQGWLSFALREILLFQEC